MYTFKKIILTILISLLWSHSILGQNPSKRGLFFLYAIDSISYKKFFIYSFYHGKNTYYVYSSRAAKNNATCLEELRLYQSYKLNYKYKSAQIFNIDERGIVIDGLNGIGNSKTGLHIDYDQDSTGYATNIFGNKILCSAICTKQVSKPKKYHHIHKSLKKRK
jgi:hypothetical protein